MFRGLARNTGSKPQQKLTAIESHHFIVFMVLTLRKCSPQQNNDEDIFFIASKKSTFQKQTLDMLNPA